ncbi:DUF3833 family protein [Ensifer sp.]|uniref:DUF3833 family protein n=1 Tax=Ensifer sp. TaxID=1872086 RepID=UPI0039C89108
MRLIAALLVNLSFVLMSGGHAAVAKDFTLEGFFAGRTHATGSFRAITGLRRTFTVMLVGTWNGRVLSLREDFVFDDGSRDRKTWRFVKIAPGRYRGTREDVAGETQLRIDGNVARFSYLVFLDAAKRTNQVRFHDTMTLRPDGTVLNTAFVTKFGLPVAWTHVAFRRR